MTEKSLDTRESVTNIASKEKLLREIDGALVSLMQKGTWGTLRIEFPVANGIAQHGKLLVEHSTPLVF